MRAPTAIAGLAALAALAALASPTARAERPRIYAITGARIVTAPGAVIENGTVVLRDGLIEAVGPKVAAPADAEVIAAEKNWTVYPAFIDAASSVGLDTEAGAAPNGAGRGAPEPKRTGAKHELKSVHPEDEVIDRVDFSHASFARHREMGFATAQVLPDKGVFRGESAVLMLRTGSAADLVARDRAAAVVALESSSFMARQYPSSKFGAVAAVRQVFLDAQRQGVWSERYAANPAGMEPPGFRSSDAPLLEVLRGGRPVVWVAINGLDPGRFGNLSREFGLTGTMTVARGLGDREQDLRAADMPVLLPLEMPEKPDLKDADAQAETSLRQMQEALLAPKLPAALAADGVKVAFVTLGMKSPRRFPENLAAVVKAGLTPDAALAAVTTTPAALLGLSRSMGTLEPGKQANLLVVEGDLFVDKPVIRHFFIEGYQQEIEKEKVVGDPNAVVDPRGTWKITSEVMGRASESTWTIVGRAGQDEAGGKRRYAGASESARSGKRDFASVEVTGNAMTVISNSPNGEMKVTVVVTGESLSGESTMTSEKGSMKMKVEGRRTAGPEGSQQ